MLAGERGAKGKNPVPWDECVPAKAVPGSPPELVGTGQPLDPPAEKDRFHSLTPAPSDSPRLLKLQGRVFYKRYFLR